MVAVPWPAANGAGTWQQYVSVPEGHLVSPPAWKRSTQAHERHAGWRLAA